MNEVMVRGRLELKQKLKTATFIELLPCTGHHLTVTSTLVGKHYDYPFLWLRKLIPRDVASLPRVSQMCMTEPPSNSTS